MSFLGSLPETTLLVLLLSLSGDHKIEIHYYYLPSVVVVHVCIKEKGKEKAIALCTVNGIGGDLSSIHGVNPPIPPKKEKGQSVNSMLLSVVHFTSPSQLFHFFLAQFFPFQCIFVSCETNLSLLDCVHGC